ncbi:MAG: NEW3 domain-containing protein [Candidatus Zixiibacteriota bacterium]
MKLYRIIALLVFALFVTTSFGAAQIYNPFNQRDDQYRLLGLKRAKEAYETAKSEFARQQELFDKKLISISELENAKSVFADAEVNFQQSLLAVLFEKQYVTVSKAVKYHAADGTKRVKLTLVNPSGGTEEFRKLINIDDELFRSLQPDVIGNIYVSLLNDENAIISQPYEIKIDELHYGKPAEVEFTILQDLDAVKVFMIYGNGSTREMKIFLQKDASVNRVEVQSEQFSQEIELGKTASYDLTLELFSGARNTFSLEVVNLPLQIGRYFMDGSGNVRLSQVKFTETTHTKRASLEVTLPDRPTDEVVMDKPIPFFVLVLPRDMKKNIPDLDSKMWTETELQALDVGYVKLELLPRGKGELLVRAPQLYHAIPSDGRVDMFMEVFNEGSHRLDNIEFTVDLPLNWTKEINPERIQSLDIGKDERVQFAFSPPDGVSVGKYEVRVRTTAMSNNQPVISEDKTIIIEIEAEANVWGTTIIVLLVLGLVTGIVIFGVRLSRR